MFKFGWDFEGCAHSMVPSKGLGGASRSRFPGLDRLSERLILFARSSKTNAHVLEDEIRLSVLEPYRR